MLLVKILLLCSKVYFVFTDSQKIIAKNIHEEQEFYKNIAQIVGSHFKNNGWHTIFTVGRFPADFYKHVNQKASFVNIDLLSPEQGIDDVIHYSTNSVLMESHNMTHFQAAFKKVLESPYWHPHAHILIISKETDEMNLVKMFFISWYYSAFNVVILQHKEQQTYLVSEFTPYVHKNFKMQKSFGCWTTKKLGALIHNYAEDFVCVEGCHNVTFNSVLRRRNLGTCLGYWTKEIKLSDQLNLYQDKSRNYHGFTFRAHNLQLVPFMDISVDDSGKVTIGKRDGMIWNVISKKMNFSVDMSPSKNVWYQKFRIDTNVKQIVECASKKVDLVLFPVYQMDLVIVDVDLSVQFKDSGLCYLARRAPFANSFFDRINFKDNASGITFLIMCVFALWLGIFIFYASENEFSFDLAGRAFVNTMRNVLSNSLFKPPKQMKFRILMITSILGFFLINFASQAIIIFYFTTLTRGKEVNTLDDVISKGYPIIGLTTPDAILPDTEERYLKLNSKLVGTQDMYGCAYQMINDSHRFCLIECSLARYMHRNLLDERGEQYLHVAEERVHSYYLCMVFQKHSLMTNRFNKYLSILVEAGLISKWEENRYDIKKEEIPIKPLGLKELGRIFKLLSILLAFDTAVFVGELVIGYAPKTFGAIRIKYKKWTNMKKGKKQVQVERKLGKIKLNSTATQTTFEALP